VRARNGVNPRRPRPLPERAEAPRGLAPCATSTRGAEHAIGEGQAAASSRRRGWATVLLFLTPLLMSACGSDSAFVAPADGGGGTSETSDTGTIDGPGTPDAPGADAGGEADAPVADAPPDTAPPGCDPAKDPKDSAPCVADAYGLFVDASKLAGGTGNKASPFNTIGAALAAAATATQKRIYVCEGTYAEAVSVTSAISLYGGWKCADWSYTGTKAKVVPAAVGYALSVANVAGALTLEDLEFDALPGTTAARSSVAAFVSATPSLTLSRVALAAGAGAPGGDGTAGVTGTPTPADLNGITGGAAGSNANKVCTCSSGGSSTGGQGGTGAVDPAGTGNDGLIVQVTPVPAGFIGKGQSATRCAASDGVGIAGSAAPVGANAAAGASVGTLDASGWHGTGGATGVSGTPGQGGGGGGGAAASQGGGGACGGCGGTGGTGGTAGGSSIALLAVSSPVNLVSCTLTTRDAAKGGSGKLGGTGQAGGTKGIQSGGACSGGNGGAGGGGGSGSGGAGGVSIGVLYQGTMPTLDSATTGAISTGVLGAAGTGGAAGTNDGKGGAKADVKDVATL
jgi:hypothetical protein